MTEIKFLLLLLLVGLTGWSSWWLFFSAKGQESNLFQQLFLVFLSGFAVASVFLFLLTFVGWFQWKFLLAFFFGLSGLYVWKIHRKSIQPQIRLMQYVGFCFLLGLFSICLGKISRSFEALLWADDASVFSGMASQLARSGSLTYIDPLVLEMSEQERTLILENRIPSDTTGLRIRFPGGVRMMDSSAAKVGFSFYHLLPAWLALGIQTMGSPGYLYLLSLFSAISLITLYFLGEHLSGPLLGVSLPIVFFLFYPQLYFSKMPSSEILSQLLFFAGLLVLFTGAKNAIQPERKQLLVGVIWGALFLCRLESLFMLSVSLILVFSWVPVFSKNQKQWRSLILPMILFALLAVYYQVIRGEYLYVLTSNQVSSNQTIVMLGIALYDAMNQFLRTYPTLSHFIFAGLCVSIVGFYTIRNGKMTPTLPSWLKGFVGSLIAAGLLLPIVTNYVSWSRLELNIQWISLYFSPIIFLVLVMGLLFFAFRYIRHPERSSFESCIVILFLVPTVVYFLNPLLPRNQPWGIRRFVPVVFPLFFLISLGGWLSFFRKFLRSRIFQKAVYSLLIVLTASMFYRMSGYLLKDSLYQNLTLQVIELGRRIPSNALIVIPESWSGIHLQMPLQYFIGLDTLLLPMHDKLGNKLKDTISVYLARQIERRPVVVLSDGNTDLPRFLRPYFRYDFQFHRILSFAHVPRTRQLIFPDHSEDIFLDVSAFTLHKNNSKIRNVLLYDDPNISFVNFYNKEKGFRWTREKSTIEDFSFPTHNKKVVATLSTIPEFTFYKQNELDLRLIVNGGIFANLVEENNGNYIFEIDGGMISEIHSATIESKTFVPVDEKVNSDPRRLGICYSGIRFETK